MTSAAAAGSSGPHRYVVLDGLRGVAALAVVLLHAWSLIADPIWVPKSGHLAVDLFFVLSGFVVAGAYDQRLAGGLTGGRFLRLRLIRLYPLYLTGALIGAAVLALALVRGQPTATNAQALWASAPFQLLFLPSPFGGAKAELYPYNPVAWSLLFELLVNLAYGVFHRWLSDRIVALAAALGAAGLVLSLRLYGHVEGGFDWLSAWVGVARVLFGFSVGVLLQRRAAAGAALGVSGLGVCMALAALLWSDPGPWRAAYEAFAVLVAAPALVWLGAGARSARWTAPAYLALGRLSYPLYAVHQPFVLLTLMLAWRLQTPLPFALAVYGLGVCALAWILAGWDEKFRAALGAAVLGPRRTAGV